MTKETITTRQTKNAYLGKTYGINIDEYDEMLKAQGGNCAICGRNEYEFSVSLHVDHYHVKGFKNLPRDGKKRYIRGLLCFQCNRGYYREDETLLQRASEYFGKYSFMKNPEYSKKTREAKENSSL